MKSAKAASPSGGRTIGRNLLLVTCLCILASCAGGRPVVPSAATGWDFPVTPDHGASALPGATLPCGFPKHSKGHNASCPVAINVKVPALRNPHEPVAKIPGLHPDALQQAYGFPFGAMGMTVAIVVAYDDRRAEKDLARYRDEFGLGECSTQNGCFHQVNQRGETKKFPHFDKAWAQEVSLDLDMVSAVCPRCPLLVVDADSASIDDLGASVDTAVRLGARVVSNSYYADEWSGEASEDAHYHHPGVAITVSAGDRAQPYYPAASPYVTSVGGLTVTASGSAWNESAWQYGGQGCSRFEPRPSFQPDLCSSMRSTVDVAMVADPQTGVTMFSTQNGGWVVAGGTSVGAPILAAAYALSGHPAGPAFAYANPGDFRDVSPAGFDVATGLGSPVGVAGL